MNYIFLGFCSDSFLSYVYPLRYVKYYFSNYFLNDITPVLILITSNVIDSNR